jgi:hypothetical protein
MKALMSHDSSRGKCGCMSSDVNPADPSRFREEALIWIVKIVVSAVPGETPTLPPLIVNWAPAARQTLGQEPRVGTDRV